MMASRRALLTYPGLSFPSRTRLVSTAGATSPARSAMLRIRHADVLVNVEHGQDLFAVRIGSPQVALAGSHPLTMPDVVRPHHRQLPTPSSKSVAETSLPSLTHTCR